MSGCYLWRWCQRHPSHSSPEDHCSSLPTSHSRGPALTGGSSVRISRPSSVSIRSDRRRLGCCLGAVSPASYASRCRARRYSALNRSASSAGTAPVPTVRPPD
eukprot:EG_transcript_49249